MHMSSLNKKKKTIFTVSIDPSASRNIKVMGMFLHLKWTSTYQSNKNSQTKIVIFHDEIKERKLKLIINSVINQNVHDWLKKTIDDKKAILVKKLEWSNWPVRKSSCDEPDYPSLCSTGIVDI